jgi:membrane protein
MLASSDLVEAVTRQVWGVDPASLPVWRAKLIRFLRFVWVIVRDLFEGQLTLQATSLVYTTLLSLVPLLAVSFSVLKGFGVHNLLEPVLLRTLEPLGEQGGEIARNIIMFVENMRVGVLGALGLGLLIYTVVSLIQKIERAFNYAWRVSRPRSFAQRFSDYLSVIVIGPVLAFSALGATASVMSLTFVQRAREIEALGTLIDETARFVPYLLIIAAFGFVYVLVPNTKVRLSSALVGAVVAGALWQGVGWVFASFVVTSTKYAAIYSSLAILIFFMIWLYLSWLIMLVGASIAFYYQHPEELSTRRRELLLSNRLKERLALAVMYRIGGSHLRGDARWSAETLAREVSVPLEAIESVLAALEANNLLVRTDAEPPGYVPARALEALPIKSLLDAVRRADEDPYLNLAAIVSAPPIEQLARDLDLGVEGVLRDKTLRDLVSEQATGANSVRPPAERSERPGGATAVERPGRETAAK